MFDFVSVLLYVEGKNSDWYYGYFHSRLTLDIVSV